MKKKLEKATMSPLTLLHANQITGAARASASQVRSQAPAKRPARPRRVRGPAMAILNSTPGAAGSRLLSATPPKMKSVMLRIGIPPLSATYECPSSCIRIQAKTTRLVAAPTRP